MHLVDRIGDELLFFDIEGFVLQTFADLVDEFGELGRVLNDAVDILGIGIVDGWYH